MNPVTHLLASWSLAEASRLEARDRALITWIGIAPDLDALGIIPDMIARRYGFTDPTLYGRYHHLLLHGIFGAVVLSALGGAFARRRLAVFLWGVAVVHFHLLCDLAGARGPTTDDIWPVYYLGPFSENLTLSWARQWPLNAWPNVAFTAALMAFVLYRSATIGHSPLSLISNRANAAFAATVRTRWGKVRGLFGSAESA